MRASSDDQARSHTNWVASLNEARSTCRKALMQASVDVSDPKRALWPAVPRRQMTQEHLTVAKCHAAVLDYAEHVEPFANTCSGLWTEDIAQPFVFPDEEALDICLDEIEAWSDRRYEVTVGGKHELTGASVETEYRRVHLPTYYCRLSFRQLNRCLEKLSLAVDLPEETRVVTGPEDAW